MEARPNKRAREEQPAEEPEAAPSSGGSSSSSSAAAADALPPSACPHCLHVHEPGTSCAACGHRWQQRAAAGLGAESGGGSSSSSSSSLSSAAAGVASREELLALLAARDAQLAAAMAAGGTMRTERDAARTERDAARAVRDMQQRLLERPSLRAFMLGERLIDVIGIVAAMGFAAEVSQCLYLCGETWRKGDRGATNDMLARSLERQCGARAARAAGHEDFVHPRHGYAISGTTQLMRAAALNNLPRVLQLVQLGAPLEFKYKNIGWTALHWACDFGREHVTRALLDGKFEGRGVEADARDKWGWTPLMAASQNGHEAVVRLLLARGARQELQDSDGWTALFVAVQYDHAGTVALLCAAPGAAAALLLRDDNGKTPLDFAIESGHAACEAVLRAHGANI
jgi:hypothetical protein